MNADLRDRIRNYPGDGPHQAGAGDAAPDDQRAAERVRAELARGVSLWSDTDMRAVLADYDRLRSEVAALHSGDDVAAWLRVHRDRLARAGASDSVLDAVHGLMDAWRSAAGSLATGQPPSWCPTCAMHVVPQSTYVDEKTSWTCCCACSTALTAAGPTSAPDRSTLRCDRCGATAGPDWPAAGEPIVYFIRDGLCHPCSRAAGTTPP